VLSCPLHRFAFLFVGVDQIFVCTDLFFTVIKWTEIAIVTSDGIMLSQNSPEGGDITSPCGAGVGAERVMNELKDFQVNEKGQDISEFEAMHPVDVIFTPFCSKCTICCTLPFRKSSAYESEGLFWDEVSAWDWDGGLDGLAAQKHSREHITRVPVDIAKTTVEATSKHLAQLKEQLMKAGLQKHYNQNYCGNSLTSARVIAPFDFSELEFGNVLGVGGFSSVSEIVSIRSNARTARRLHRIEDQSRQSVASNVLYEIETARQQEKKILSNLSKSSDKSRQHRQLGTQFAVKHLRSKLISRTPEKFKRAAIDLVLEGQLLLLMDHPHIVRLHGWSVDGPKAYTTGDIRGYFLILDKLPISLEDRMLEWRNSLTKYQRQFKRQNSLQQKSTILSSWARRTLRFSKEEGVPKAPVKANAMILQLLLERLRVALGLAQAVQYLHSKKIIHRDLKITNVGFDVHGQVKLFDFGLSRLLPLKTHALTQTTGDDSLVDKAIITTEEVGMMNDSYVMSRVGTKFYMAPEVRRKDPYGLPADVYSFGVILWEVLTLSTPRDLYHHERDQLYKSGKEKGDTSKLSSTSQRPKDGVGSWLPVCPCWPKGLRDLVHSSMSGNPEDRPTMAEIVVTLQQHVDALAGDAFDQQRYGTKHKEFNSRVDLSRVDLHWLDKVDNVGKAYAIGSN
jgi:serine/threonine protein kinase